MGAEIELGRLPVSSSLLEFHPNDAARWQLQISGGDDYELCFCVPPAQCGQVEAVGRRLGVPLNCIGEIRPAAADTVRLLLDGQPFTLPPQAGYNHFQDI